MISHSNRQFYILSIDKTLIIKSIPLLSNHYPYYSLILIASNQSPQNQTILHGIK